MLLVDLVPGEELKNVQLGRLLGWRGDAKGLVFERKRMTVFPLSSIF